MTTETERQAATAGLITALTTFVNTGLADLADAAQPTAIEIGMALETGLADIRVSIAMSPAFTVEVIFTPRDAAIKPTSLFTARSEPTPRPAADVH